MVQIEAPPIERRRPRSRPRPGLCRCHREVLPSRWQGLRHGRLSHRKTPGPRPPRPSVESRLRSRSSRGGPTQPASSSADRPAITPSDRGRWASACSTMSQSWRHGSGHVASGWQSWTPEVHHGNGTRTMMADDPGTLYVSIHQGDFYPYEGHPGALRPGRPAPLSTSRCRPAAPETSVVRHGSNW